MGEGDARAGRTIAFVGAPTDVGAEHRGGSMGLEALRIAGLDRALRLLGHSVVDRGDVSGPPNPDGVPVGGYRHLEEVTRRCEAVRDGVHAVLDVGQFPMLLGGDHCLAP